MKMIDKPQWSNKITEFNCKELYKKLKTENKLDMFLDLIDDKDLQIYLRNKKLKNITK